MDVKSKKILSMRVTDEHVHDSTMLPELIEKITKSNKIICKLLFADCAYEGNDIFRCLLEDNGVLSCIKVRKNLKIKLKTGHILRNLSVVSQKNDLQRWRGSIVRYGKRWIVETVFSTLKMNVWRICLFG